MSTEIKSIQDIIELRRRLIADPTSVSDEEIRAALEFARSARSSTLPAKQKPKSRSISIDDIQL